MAMSTNPPIHACNPPDGGACFCSFFLFSLIIFSPYYFPLVYEKRLPGLRLQSWEFSVFRLQMDRGKDHISSASAPTSSMISNASSVSNSSTM